jgi:uncharacterized protein (TIGR02391 family)
LATLKDHEIQAIADALGDTGAGLTGSEITSVLSSLRLPDPSPQITKRVRLFNAFVADQNRRQDRTGILEFIRQAMAPPRWLRDAERFEPLRANLNAALAFVALQVLADGTLESAAKATTIGEAENRARKLREDLDSRRVHPDVLKFCRSELLEDNYFHAVLEAVKSVAEKVRSRTGLLDDGATLVQRAFGGEIPMLAINTLTSISERDEQKGFVNLLTGIFGMFRNPTAHAAKIIWEMKKDDAEDLLSLLSLVHRRIDLSVMPPRV